MKITRKVLVTELVNDEGENLKIYGNFSLVKMNKAGYKVVRSYEKAFTWRIENIVNMAEEE